MIICFLFLFLVRLFFLFVGIVIPSRFLDFLHPPFECLKGWPCESLSEWVWILWSLLILICFWYCYIIIYYYYYFFFFLTLLFYWYMSSYFFFFDTLQNFVSWFILVFMVFKQIIYWKRKKKFKDQKCVLTFCWEGDLLPYIQSSSLVVYSHIV